MSAGGERIYCLETRAASGKKGKQQTMTICEVTKKKKKYARLLVRLIKKIVATRRVTPLASKSAPVKSTHATRRAGCFFLAARSSFFSVSIIMYNNTFIRKRECNHALMLATRRFSFSCQMSRPFALDCPPMAFLATRVTI